MKLAEPKEAPLKKPDKDMFDPKNFLAKVGTGKQVLEFHKNQHVFEQVIVASTRSRAAIRSAAKRVSRYASPFPGPGSAPGFRPAEIGRAHV